MKKYYIMVVASLFLSGGGNVFAQDDTSLNNLTVDKYTTVSTTTAYDYINFTTSDTTLDYTSRITIKEGINVGDGVTAVLENQSSQSSVRLATGSEDITITGASADTSTLVFRGRYIDGGIDTGDNPLFTTSINLKDVTFAMQRRITGTYGANGLELKSLNAEDSIIQIYQKVSTSSGSETIIKTAEGISLNRSQLFVDTGAQLTLSSNTSSSEGLPISLTDSIMAIDGGIVFEKRPAAFQFSGENILTGSTGYTLASASINDGATLIVSGGNKTITTIDNSNGLKNATLKVEEGILTVGSATANLTMSGSNIVADGSLSASSTQFDFSGKNSISGSGTVDLKVNLGASQLYITSKNFTTGKEIHVKSADAIASIGQDSNTVKSAVNFTGNIQADNGKLIITGGSVINSEERASKTFVINNGATAEIDNATIYVVSSRICAGVFNGTIVTYGSNTGGTRDYSLSFGAWNFGGSQRSTEIAKNVILGANAAANVNASSATFFGIYGTVISQVATQGALKSNENAPLMIYKDTTLTLKTTDAFAVGGATSQKTSDFNFYAGAQNITLDIDATNNIGRLVYGSASTEVKLDVASGAVLTIGSIVLSEGGRSSQNHS